MLFRLQKNLHGFKSKDTKNRSQLPWTYKHQDMELTEKCHFKWRIWWMVRIWTYSEGKCQNERKKNGKKLTQWNILVLEKYNVSTTASKGQKKKKTLQNHF